MRKSVAPLLLIAGAAASMGCSGRGSSSSVGSIDQALEVTAPCAAASPDSPLAQAACASGRLVGTAVVGDAVVNNPEYAAVLAREFTYVTPENEMKWGTLQPDGSDTWNFAPADTVVAAAQDEGQAIKGHALVWHEQLPSFVTPELERKELDKLVRKHIKETTKRYREHVAAWDVVNEAVEQDGTMRQSVLYDVLGPSYVADAFITAAEYTKDDGYDADLLYYDWGIATVNPKSDGVYALLADLVAQGVPVDGVGMQAHVDARYAPTVAGLVENFQRFADLGLTVNISELDVRVAGIPGSKADKLALQQKIYHTIAYACAQVPACEAITVWGLSDAYSWVDGFFGADDPLLLDEGFGTKPAYRGMVDGLLGLEPDAPNQAPNLATSGSFETDAAGWYGFGTEGVELVASARSGNQALLGGGRTASWQGPALDLKALVQPGFEYSVDAFVQLAGAESANVDVNLKTKCAGEDAQYPWVGGTMATDTGFSTIGAEFAIPYCTLEDVALYFNGPDGGVGIVLDDVVVRQTAEPLGEELIGNTDFETDTSGWFNFGTEPVVSHTTVDAHEGTGALLATDRADTWQGPATSLTSQVLQGATYRASAFVKLSGASLADVKISLKTVCDGVEDYGGVASSTADDLVWTELVGSFQVPLCENLSEVTLYVEGPAAGVDLLVDDTSVAQRLAVPVVEPADDGNVLADGDFESGQVDWYGWGGTVAVTDALAHSGNQSLSVSGSSVGAIALNLESTLVPGETYELSYWVALDGVDSAELHVTGAINCGSGTSWSWLTNTPVVTPGEWVELTGTLTLPADCTNEQIQLYVEADAETVINPVEPVTLYVDDVYIGPPTNFMSNGDFETDTSGWYAWGGTALSTSSLYAHSGNQSLAASGASIGPAATDLAAVLEPGGTYSLSYWITLEGADTATAWLTGAIGCTGSGDAYSALGESVTVTAGEWTELTGTLSLPADCTMDKVQPYVEGSVDVPEGTVVTLYVDDVVVGQ